jgi:hypothetical protein
MRRLVLGIAFMKFFLGFLTEYLDHAWLFILLTHLPGLSFMLGHLNTSCHWLEQLFIAFYVIGFVGLM